MATTNPATLKLSESDDAPIKVYRGKRTSKTWGPYGPEESEGPYYLGLDGKEITDFDPKKHTVFGEIFNGFGVPYSSGGIENPDVDPFYGQSGEFQDALLKGRPAGVTGIVADPSTSRPAKAITPDDVKAAAKANPASPAQQKSVAEQQADYIRSKGGRTAAEADAEFESNLRKDYSEATGFDINTAEGRRKSFQAALQRGGHADAMARNLRAGKYAYLDPNSDAGMKASDAAYQKHYKGKDWVGDNPLTGEMKDVEGNIWDSQDAYNQSGMNPNAPKVEPSGEILTPEQATASRMRSMKTRLEEEYDPEMMQYSFIRDQLNPTGKSMRRFQEGEAQDYANNAIADSLRVSNAPVQGPDMKGWGNQVANFLRARVRANQEGDDSLDNMGTGDYFDPNFLHRTKGNAVNDLGRDPSAGYGPDTDNVSGFSNGFGVRVPVPNENFRMPQMPQGDVEDAIDARSFGNAMRPSQPRFAPYGRPLGPMGLNRPNLNIRVPMDRPKFK